MYPNLDRFQLPPCEDPIVEECPVCREEICVEEMTVDGNRNPICEECLTKRESAVYDSFPNHAAYLAAKANGDI